MLIKKHDLEIFTLDGDEVAEALRDMNKFNHIEKLAEISIEGS